MIAEEGMSFIGGMKNKTGDSRRGNVHHRRYERQNRGEPKIECLS